MCCGSKGGGRSKGSKSGKITRTKKTLKTQAENEQYLKDRERLLLPPDGQLPNETRDLEPPKIS
jgi:hypothetical protein